MENVWKDNTVAMKVPEYRVMQDRVFEASPEFWYRGRLVTGMCVGLLFRFYKGEEEVYFEENAQVEVCDHVICSLDKDAEDGCQFGLRPYLVEDWFDRFEVEVAEWAILIYQGTTSDIILEDLPDDLVEAPVSFVLPVTKEEFVRVLREHWGNFSD